MIKFSCPHCNRVINVKDEMAGKRGKCTGCKHAITVPSAPPKTKPTGRSGDDLEALAACLLGDTRKDDASRVTVDFACPYCDAELHLPGDLAGKQAPCPECRRIIKVPQLTKTAPRDWRRPDAHTMPSGAKREDAPPDGAWDTQRGSVSRAALVEAAVIKEVRQPITIKQWIAYGMAAVVLVSFTAIGLTWYFRSRTEKMIVGGIDTAEKLVNTDVANSPPARQAELHVLLGEYHQRAQTYDKQDRPIGVLHLREARKALGLIEDPTEKQVLARQFLHVAAKLNLGEDELSEGFVQLPSGHFRDTVLHEVARIMLSNAPSDKLDEQIGTLRQVVQRGMGANGAQDVHEVLNGVGIVGQEAVRTGHLDVAQRLADAVRPSYKADQPYPAHFGALLAMANRPALEGAKDRPAIEFGQMEAQAWLGNFAAAQDVIAKQFTTPSQAHLDAELTLADAMIQKDQKDGAAARLTSEVTAILERNPDGMAWGRQRVIELLIAADKLADAERLVSTLLKGPPAAWAQGMVVEAKARQSSPPNAELLTGLSEDTDAYNHAVALAAREWARKDSNPAMAWAEGLSNENAKAYGMLGASLGMQDGRPAKK